MIYFIILRKGKQGEEINKISILKYILRRGFNVFFKKYIGLNSL